MTLDIVLDNLPLPPISQSEVDSKDGLTCVSGNAPMKFCRSDCRLDDDRSSSIEALKVKSGASFNCSELLLSFDFMDFDHFRDLMAGVISIISQC